MRISIVLSCKQNSWLLLVMAQLYLGCLLGLVYMEVGEGVTPLYKPYRYVPPHRVGFLLLHRFGQITGIHFAHFGLESGMVFEGTTDQCI